MNLKKSALAVGVAAIMAVPAATTVYAADQAWSGRVHYRLVSAKDEDMAIENAGHRIGVKGSGDANSGNKVGYHIEGEIQGETAAVGPGSRNQGPIEWRHHNVWVGGGWGTVTVGRQNNPLNRVYKSDIFETNSGPFEMAQGYRIGDAAIYEFSGKAFGIYGGVVIDGQGDSTGANVTEDIDSTIIGADLNVGKSLSFSLVNQAVAEDGSGSAKASITGVGGSWTIGKFLLAGYYETESESATTVIDVAGLWGATDNLNIGLGYAVCESEDIDIECGVGLDTQETQILVGAYYTLGGGADTYLEYGQRDEADTNNLSWGYRVKFN